MRVLSQDNELQDAIRSELGDRTTGAMPAQPARSGAVAKLKRDRQKLLDLYYADKITAALFAEQESKLTRQIDAIEADAAESLKRATRRNHLAEQFEQIAATLREIDTDSIWNAANDSERRTLVNEIIENVIVHSDRLQVTIHGAPPLTVTLEEVGLRTQPGTRIDVSEDRT